MSSEPLPPRGPRATTQALTLCTVQVSNEPKVDQRPGAIQALPQTHWISMDSPAPSKGPRIQLYKMREEVKTGSQVRFPGTTVTRNYW